MRLRQIKFYALSCLALLLATGSLWAKSEEVPTTFRIQGTVTKAQTWSVSRLEQELKNELKTIDYSIKGKEYTSRCVPLLSLIKAAEPSFNTQQKHSELRFLIRVQGRDGYSVWYSLGELLPEFGNRTVYVALDVNGKPYSDREAPIRLIVPGEKDYGRWIYGIATITIVDGAQLKVP